MVVSYERGIKSLPVFWFVSGLLSASCGQRQRCACVRAFVWVWVWGDGNGCVVGEKVTNAGGRACLGKFFSLSFFPPHFMFQAREQRGNSNQNNLCALAWEMCPCSPQISSLLWGKGHTSAVGWRWGGVCRRPPPGAWIPGTVPLLAPLIFIKAWLNIFLCF